MGKRKGVLGGKRKVRSPVFTEPGRGYRHNCTLMPEQVLMVNSEESDQSFSDSTICRMNSVSK